jgi:four helix bundle protein
MEIQSYRDLNVWKKSMNLVLEVYKLSRLFPKEEQFGLTSQIRRAAVSIPSNIAEGHGRIHIADYLRFLSISRGSLMEVETHLEIAVRLDYLTRHQITEAREISAEVGRILNGLIRALIEKNGSSSNGRIAETTEPYETGWPPTPDPYEID